MRTLTGSPLTEPPRVNPRFYEPFVRFAGCHGRTSSQREQRHSQTTPAEPTELHVLWVELHLDFCDHVCVEGREIGVGRKPAPTVPL